jgi:formylglycine-generating enzyme required for sulfatase activity
VAAGGGRSLSINGVTLRFVAIPPGTVAKGCADGDPDCRDDEKPVQRLRLDAFQMSATEVTQEFWQAVTGENPSDFKGADRPVENVSWNDAQEFIDRVNQRDTGLRYRLPTEAGWEYAARAGDDTQPNLAAVAWFGLTGGGSRQPRPQTVASKSANRWGLYDMLGNVAEWCEDWYAPNYQRVVKGGAWDDSAASLRPSARGKATVSTRTYSIGVRLVREPR